MTRQQAGVSAEAVGKLVQLHSIVVWDDQWRCRCSGWALGNANGTEQLFKSWAEHFVEQAALATAPPEQAISERLETQFVDVAPAAGNKALTTKQSAEPKCWHKEIDDEGICKACGAKAAIKLEGLSVRSVSGRSAVGMHTDGLRTSQAAKENQAMSPAQTASDGALSAEPLYARWRRLFGADLSKSAEDVAFIKDVGQIYNDGWEAMHELMPCGHSRGDFRDAGYIPGKPETYTGSEKCVGCEHEVAVLAAHDQKVRAEVLANILPLAISEAWHDGYQDGIADGAPYPSQHDIDELQRRILASGAEEKK